MTTQEVADQLVEMCRKGENAKAYDVLFAKHAVAVEPVHTQQPETKGLDALKEKTAYFQSTVKEFHGSHVSDPLVAGNFFSCTMSIDMTNKDDERIKMDEICVYEVKDGKIVKEQFFF